MSDKAPSLSTYQTMELSALRVAVEESQTPTAIADKQGIIVYVNDAMRALHHKYAEQFRRLVPGFQPEQVVGSSMDLFHRNPAHIRAILTDPYRLPHVGHINAEGLSFELIAHYVRDEHGEYAGNVLEWFDRTEDMLLRREKEAFDVVLNQQLGRVEFNPDGVILTANALFLSIMGYTLEEIKGRHHRMFVSKEDIDSGSYNTFWNRLAAGESLKGVFIRMAKGGRQVVLEGEYFPVKDNQGKIVKVIKLAKDVTELQRLEQLATRLRASIDGASANLLYCDENFKVFHINPAMRIFLNRYGPQMREAFPGLDLDNPLGQSLDWLVRGEYGLRERFANPTLMPFDFEVSFAGRIYQIHVTMIRGGKGEYLGNRVEFIDITEQRLAEQDIQDLITKAAAGMLDERLDTSRYRGFLQNLSKGINALLDTISQPIHAAGEAMKALAEGDLTRMVDGAYQGEFGELQEAINSSMQTLRQMVTEIRHAADSISTAAGEISQGNQDLARRTEQQAASLETTASSMEEITGTVKNNAENAARADKLAIESRNQAAQGGEIARRTIGAMAEIKTSSDRIADIIGVIDEIAFQTNLLALNAAVEAARAGEQGRGFAVVAAEVRNLAQRSASAAKEIKALIKDSLEKVAEGSRLVDETGKMLDGIQKIAGEVSEVISQIAIAGKEQAIGVEQIGKALVKLDEMTQQNAALVEEAAVASSSLNDQAQTLKEQVQFFKLENAPEIGLPRGGRVAVKSARTLGGTSVRKVGKEASSSIRSEDNSDWDQF